MTTSSPPSPTRAGRTTSTTAEQQRGFPFGLDSLRRLFIYAIAIIVVTSAVGFLITGSLDASLGELDRRIADWFATNRTPGLNDLTWLVGSSADVYVKIPVTVALSVFFLWKLKSWAEAALLTVALAYESGLFVLISFIVGRDRPDVIQLDSIPPTGSFPSGHAAAAVAFYGSLAAIAWSHTTNRVVRGIAVVVAIAMPPLVAMSRLYRGMHFTSDVVVGLTLGILTLWLVLREWKKGVVVKDPHRL